MTSKTVTILLHKFDPVMDFYMSKYENFLLLGDFNSQMSERAISEFCETYNFTNLVKEPTSFKNPNNLSPINLILQIGRDVFKIQQL